MITLYKQGAYLAADGRLLAEGEAAAHGMTDKQAARKETIAYRILEAHNTSGNMESLALKFDALASHDITFRRQWQAG